MQRYEKVYFMGMASLTAYSAVVLLLLLLLGETWALLFIAVTATLAALGLYGSVLEDDKKKRDTRIF